MGVVSPGFSVANFDKSGWAGQDSFSLASIPGSIAAIFRDQELQFGGQSLNANIVIMSVFGALLIYIISMASLLRLRVTERSLTRSDKAPFYPVFPIMRCLEP